jgi:predicted dehydrogenase
MATHETVNVGVIGLGFMGATHLGAYARAREAGYACRVVAAADADPAKRASLATPGNLDTGKAIDLSHVALLDSPAALLADPAIHLVSICTPTFTHVELATAALKAGKHVLLEKPVAVESGAVRTLLEAARASDRLIMPAMCMRFWPAWAWLKQAIDDHRFDRLRALNLQRLGSLPAWSGWFADPKLSGGAAIDLHVHDADFVYHAVGRPDAVTSAGHVNHLSTTYHFDRDPSLHVTAQGGWLAPGTPFRMRYVAEFEQATADFDIGRPQQLLLCRNGAADPVDPGPLNGYDGEVRHLLDCIADKATRPLATLAEAVDVTIVLETEQYAAECGQRVRITWGVDEPPGH